MDAPYFYSPSFGYGALPPDPPKICSICGDKALSCNFGSITCESCKAFFRRNAHRDNVAGRCDGQCVITVETRSYCKSCRLDKCFRMGMKKDLILTDEQRAERKRKIEENREKKKQNEAVVPEKDHETGSKMESPTKIDSSTLQVSAGEAPLSTLMPELAPKKIELLGQLIGQESTLLPSQLVRETEVSPLFSHESPEENVSAIATAGPIGNQTSPSSHIISCDLVMSSSSRLEPQSASSVLSNYTLTRMMERDASPPLSRNFTWNKYTGVSSAQSAQSERLPLISAVETVQNKAADSANSEHYSTSNHPKVPPQDGGKDPRCAYVLSGEARDPHNALFSRSTNDLENTLLAMPSLIHIDSSQQQGKTEAIFSLKRPKTEPYPRHDGNIPSDRTSLIENIELITRHQLLATAGSCSTASSQATVASLNGGSDRVASLPLDSCYAEPNETHSASEISLVTTSDSGFNSDSTISTIHPSPDQNSLTSSNDVITNATHSHPQNNTLPTTSVPTVSDTYKYTYDFFPTINSDTLSAMQTETSMLLSELASTFAQSFDVDVEEVFPNKPSFVEVFYHTEATVKYLVRMIGKLNAFKSFCTDDQISLLKSSIVELLILLSIRGYDVTTGGFYIRKSYGFQFMSMDSLKALRIGTDLMKSYHAFAVEVLQTTKQDGAIMMCLMVLLLFRKKELGQEVQYKNPSKVDKCCKLYMWTLSNYLQVKYGGQEVTFDEIMDLSVRIKKTCVIWKEALFQCTLEELSPLISEMFEMGKKQNIGENKA